MMKRGGRHLLALASVGVIGCRDSTGPCGPSTRPAIVVSALDIDSRPVSGVTIIYDRHGDDSLTLLHPTAADAIQMGTAPGIYDFRVIKAGYADWLATNVVVDADGCDPRTITMQVWMQPLP